MAGYQRVYHEEDLSMRLIAAMRHYGLAYPAPLLFGDTNWAYRYSLGVVSESHRLRNGPSTRLSKWIAERLFLVRERLLDKG